jgi:ABC-type glycerol-3-phosphate transport system substrate-binding protein
MDVNGMALIHRDHSEETTAMNRNEDNPRQPGNSYGGPISRRQFLKQMMATGLGLAGVSVGLAGCQTAPATSSATPAGGSTPAPAADTRPLTPTFYQWVEDFHSQSILRINKTFPGLNYQIAPVEGFGIERFVAEGKNKESTWDVYMGMTPFVEMTQLIEADVIEPWDPYIPKDVLNDLIPSIREECSVNGKLYNWPFLLDVCVLGWNSKMTDQAGITSTPKSWDDYLANAKQIMDSKAALYGATFDALGWRSIAPFAHSFSPDVYTPEGLFEFTSEPAIEALMLMKKIMAVSHPDILLAGTSDGGVSGTPDEVAFAARKVGYYTKFQNAILRMSGNWPDPAKVRLAALPSFSGGAGSTVFWTTGATLFKHGQNKEKAAEYIKTLTYDRQLWKESILGTETAHPGQLPPYKSIHAEWEKNKPDWMPDFVPLVRNQLDAARAITTHLFGLTQFLIGKEHWEKYLTGQVSNPKDALQAAKDAVLAELAKKK